jgi:general secretion pathway protein G
MLAIIALLGMTGCASDTDSAKKALELTLSRVNDVEYRNLQTFAGGVVCGEFDPIVRFGEHLGYRRFLVVGDQADGEPSDQDWEIYCREDQARAVREHFGLGPLDASNPSLMAIYRDMDKVDIALNEYLTDNLNYPLTAQGLEALINPSEQLPKPIRFREGGYIDAIPRDPWGRAYQYTAEEKLRLETREYRLLTLGRDGVEGGEGEDADIGSEVLPYLRHISAL